MKTIYLAILLFIGSISCYSQDEEIKTKEPIKLTLEELFKNQNKYEKQNILISGYAKFEKGISRVFISKEDFEGNKKENSLCFMFLIELSTYETVKRCNEKYITLSGIYIPSKALGPDGKIEMENGILTSVSLKSCNDNN